jgi:integrase
LKSRAYYHFGSLTLKKRAKSADVWVFRYYEDAATGGRARKALFIGTTDMYKTEAMARKAVEAILLKLNAEKPMHHLGTVTFGGLCDRYIAEELPERYSTRKSYLSNINLHIKPRWGEYLIAAIRPMAIEGWFKEMDKSPKTKAHIRSVMHVIFECAARWELFNERRNPIEMIRVKDSTKRRKRPMILTNDSFDAVLAGLPEPFRTMVVVAQCLGLRVSEITGLQWGDLDTERRQLLVQRSVVNGRVDDVKTEYSHDHVPIHDSLLEVLLGWSEQCPETEEGWMFPNPLSSKPYYSTEIQKRYLKPAGIKLGLGPIGWHTFRHTYRSWLDETGAPMKVQQELMRHASIQTTMNVYGQAMPESKREANGKVVTMVLKPLRGERLKCRFSYWE